MPEVELREKINQKEKSVFDFFIFFIHMEAQVAKSLSLPEEKTKNFILIDTH